jgi:DNA-binding CsgD family transcriptional regulator/tetratricopeptide (TPR) repeat protein
VSVQENGGTQVEREAFLPLELLERDDELAAVDMLVGTSGRGRLLAIEGPPGIGKTSLIQEARARAGDAGMQVLAARGSELEKTFAFGVVRQLFEPFVFQLTDDERTELLAGAAELASPLFEPGQLSAESPPDASLSMLHGLYWLTANVAGRRPLLIVIDDLHWCDLPSLRWLAYLLPRAEALDLLVVVAVRSAEKGTDAAVLGQVISDPFATVVRPSPLSAEAVARLIRESLSPDADDEFCAACHEITGGNPLLLRELRNGVLAENVVPTGENIPRLHELAAQAGSRTLSARLSRLPPAATRLAQAVAILGDDVDPHHAAVLAGLDDESASQAIVDLTRVDVLHPRFPLGFVHPLVRAAVENTLTPLEREAGHARAAKLLTEADAEPERIAAHLLLVPPPVDPDVVTALREAARSAACRGASESAVAYLRRALAEPEPPPAAERVGLLLELGSAEALVDGEAAAEHFEEAHGLIDDRLEKAEAAVLLGSQLFYLHRLVESDAVFSQALDELDGADPELERLLDAGLLSNGLFHPPLHERAERRLVEVRKSGGHASLGEKMLLGLLAFYDARTGTPAAAAVPLARRALADGALMKAGTAGGAFIRAVMVLTMADEDEALEQYDAALAEAHRSGSIVDFAAVKLFRAQALLFRGDLSEAEADAREAFKARREYGLRLLDPFVYLEAEALMEQGRLDEAVRVLPAAGLGESSPDDAPVYALRNTLARLRVLRGDVDGGLEALLAAGQHFEAVGGRNPAFMPWRSEAALCLLQLERRAEARAMVEEEVELARTWGAPRALGAALRVAGLVEGGKDGLVLLREAVEVLSESPSKLERARAHTELGAALRRSNRRAGAREQLRLAVELSTICGASPLASQAERELLATGARPRRIAVSGVASLTPSERRVAEMAAEGPTNREIAQALFITPKTVEVHLSSTYRKLGITSRTQLAEALVA